MSQTGTVPVTVQGFLDELQATRDEEWAPEQLRAHADLRRSLEENADRERFVRPGDVVPPFALAEVGGGSVVLDDLLADGPVVLVFFRFEGCPACNRVLRGYQLTLAPALRELDAHLVIVSPQIAERLAAIKERHGSEFLVASDPDRVLIDSFGIGFAPAEAARDESRGRGVDLGAILGTGDWVLPYPTVVVIDRDRTVRFADVHPDWMVRTESAAVLAAVRPLVGQ
ncbi:MULTISPECIES: peroxiredoxin-like family protein [unclassified Parafrankia]|uniref:peroxiredoxin-like family protein n=1 Tax=unclassified Parafrankia TaxID=2994368 RepID=UPI000DA492C1|nr:MULTISPECIES: peroxiredoxin-like family protein [unclassified Parafrankia]TCJ33878.1 AhpC/TSA family protein [Parafrankia sp. BMG5.11]SQD99124.1 Alkyl hydroperoxide reductase/ Thiol specific antioxidant/ Mal allergen [Parafrankia sp. Ea1.12]